MGAHIPRKQGTELRESFVTSKPAPGDPPLPTRPLPTIIPKHSSVPGSSIQMSVFIEEQGEVGAGQEQVRMRNKSGSSYLPTLKEE